MRYNKAHGATLRLLMDGAVPRRPDGALALCQDCQRGMWLAGGYVSQLAVQLERLAKVVTRLRGHYLRALQRLEIGDTAGVVTPMPARAIAMAKEVADERQWAILIQRPGRECVKITRVPYPESPQ